MSKDKTCDEGEAICALVRFHETLTEDEKKRLGVLIENIKALLEKEPSFSVSGMAMASVSIARDSLLRDGLKKEIDRFYESRGHR